MHRYEQIGSGSPADRLYAAVLMGLLCLATLLISFEAAWISYAIQTLVLLVLFCVVLKGNLSLRGHRWEIPVAGFCLIPAWGLLQVATNGTAYRQATISTALYWLSLLAVLVVGLQVFKHRQSRQWFLETFVWFAAFVAMLEIAGTVLPSGKLFGLIPTEHATLYGLFQYYNNAAEFLELALPVALYFSFGVRSAYAFAAGLIYSAILVSGSRTGTILGTAEILGVSFLMLHRSRCSGRDLFRRLALVGAVASIGFVAWPKLEERFGQERPLRERQELNQSSLAMIGTEPWMGFGLGTYPSVYPSFARFDSGRYVNHAHNDWLEWTAEGGIPILLWMLAIALTSIGPAIRSVWGMGAIALFIHALVDYPFQRFGTAAWIVAILAAVLAAEMSPARRKSTRVQFKEVVAVSETV